MRQGGYSTKLFVFGVLSPLLISYPGTSQARPAIPDAQVEANVLKALAGAPQLADQSITSTTVFGTVTLTGAVRNDESRDLADKLVSNTAGVQKVVDQMAVGTPSAASDAAQVDQSGRAATNPNLQSDGSLAPAEAQPSQAGSDPHYSYPEESQRQGTNAAPQRPPQLGPQRPPQYGAGYPSRPYSTEYDQRPYVSQRGGDAVVVSSGSMIRVRINQGMDSKHTAAGTVFDGVVLNDVVAGGSVAIPRGAAIRGTVVEAKNAGQLAGKGELKLQLTQLQLGGQVYPIVTDFWWHQGADKTGNTVGNTVGLGAMGALIGAVAGGGLGAAVGAGVGGVAGMGVSASSHRGEASLPAEAIVTFHLTQPADVTTVSQAELNRLGGGVPVGFQPQMQRRYYPPPPPYYYGPGYYPGPYFGPY
ncbi:MAG: BON domain-containing protein [Acidobacteriota bacterium]|nr:BON domain-containing protein [Acidobacteriota bacterium]